MCKVLPWICTAAISVLALKYFTIPYLWIFLSCAAALFVTAAMARAMRALWFNLACIALGLAISEYYLWTLGYDAFQERRLDRGGFTERIYAPDEDLGWAPEPRTAASHRASYQGDVLYDATYIIGRNGLRVSSPPADRHAASPASECIPFFGCSFTFGQGLEDRQTLPFQVGLRSDDRYRTFNFGVMGYGPHQMLSALQNGLVDDAMRCGRRQVSHVLYQAITDHVRRAAGRAWWSTRGPRYDLTRDGGVRPDGHFEDGRRREKTLTRLAANQIRKSRIYEAVVQGKYVHKYSRDTIDLYLGIVAEARDLVHARYPCAEFHVLLWDEDDVDNRAIRVGLRRRGIDLHLMSDILPHYQADGTNEIYRLHEKDPHPNALANELIAAYVVREILPQPGPCDSPETS